MIIELVNRWEVLDIKRNRTAQETGEYIALNIAMSVGPWLEPLSGRTQKNIIDTWARETTNIIMHGTPTLTVSTTEEVIHVIPDYEDAKRQGGWGV